MGFVLRAHPVRGGSYIQRNTTGEFAAAHFLLKLLLKQRILAVYQDFH